MSFAGIKGLRRPRAATITPCRCGEQALRALRCPLDAKPGQGGCDQTFIIASRRAETPPEDMLLRESAPVRSRPEQSRSGGSARRRSIDFPRNAAWFLSPVSSALSSINSEKVGLQRSRIMMACPNRNSGVQGLKPPGRRSESGRKVQLAQGIPSSGAQS